jgi:hypothetical protein
MGGVYLHMFRVPSGSEFAAWCSLPTGWGSPHWSSYFADTFTKTFPDRWIGRDGQICWPPFSPGITSLDFFLWEYVKGRVYGALVPDLSTLRNRIRDVIAALTLDMLDKT